MGADLLRGKSSPVPLPPSPKDLSKFGAFNGSGFATDNVAWGDSNNTLNLYFQHHTGTLRRLMLMQTGEWQGGDEASVLVSDARNGTPISVVAAKNGDVNTVCLADMVSYDFD
jgi:hypothetical protein